MLYLNIMLYII